MVIQKILSNLLKPHEVIGDNYLRRWHLIPRNKYFNIYLHHFVGSDVDRHMHDHPWNSVSITLKGQVIDVHPYRYPGLVSRRDSLMNPSRERMPWLWPVFRKAEHIHRVEVSRGTWTVFITGRKRKEWYFFCDNGQRVHWKEYIMNGCGS